jgi:hypothetical protein
MGVIRAIDKVKIARTATVGAGTKLPARLRLRSGGKGGGFLVPRLNPPNFSALPDGVGDAVERITNHSIKARYASLAKTSDDRLDDRCHAEFPSPSGRGRTSAKLAFNVSRIQASLAPNRINSAVLC